MNDGCVRVRVIRYRKNERGDRDRLFHFSSFFFLVSPLRASELHRSRPYTIISKYSFLYSLNPSSIFGTFTLTILKKRGHIDIKGREAREKARGHKQTMKKITDIPRGRRGEGK